MAISDKSIRDAYDAEQFRSAGHRVVDQLADYLGRATRGTNMPVLDYQPPEGMDTRWPADFPAEPSGDLATIMQRVIAGSIHQHHPHYVGHQVSPALPVAALCDFAAALLNNGMAAYESGPVSTAMERSVLRWLALQLGWTTSADGVLTSGGSLGNLTALLAARQVRGGFDVWNDGVAGGPPLAVLAADQSHYSVSRAVQIMGLGSGAVVPVPVDAQERMRPDALPDAFTEAARRGRRVFAVVASAGSTATGSFDPLHAIADFCEAHSLWLHVDGAHGASAALVDEHRSLVRGIERADSVVWDAHKLLMMPALVTAVLFRDGDRSYETFAQKASYLYAAGDPREQWFNLGIRTVECTKRMMSLKLYATLTLLGTRFFADYVARTFALTRWFAAQLREAGDFEVPVEPSCNILCFRYAPRGGTGDSSALQDAIRTRVVASGAFFLARTTLRSEVYLRTTLMNPLTTESDLEGLISAIRAAASPTTE